MDANSAMTFGRIVINQAYIIVASPTAARISDRPWMIWDADRK